GVEHPVVDLLAALPVAAAATGDGRHLRNLPRSDTVSHDASGLTGGDLCGHTVGHTVRHRTPLELAIAAVAPVEETVAARAARCRREMAATHGVRATAAWRRSGRLLLRASSVDVDRAGIERIRELGRRHPL